MDGESGNRGVKRNVMGIQVNSHPNSVGSDDSVKTKIKNALHTFQDAYSWETDKRSAAASTLCHLSQNDDYADMIVDEGAVPVLLEYVKAPPDHEPRVQSYIARTLCQLCFTKPNHQELIMDSKAIPLLLAMVIKFIRDRSYIDIGVLEIITEAIQIICLWNGNMAHTFGEQGIVYDFVKFLSFQEQKIILLVLRTLYLLANENDQNKDMIIRANAIPDLINIIFLDNIDLQIEAIHLIRLLIEGNGQNVGRRRNNFFSNGGLRPIINALSLSNRRVQTLALDVLLKLSIHPGFADLLGQYGVATTLIALLRFEDEPIQISAVRILHALSRNEHNQAGIVQEGGLSPLLEMMIGHTNGEIQLHAARIVHQICRNQDNVFKFVKFGGIQTLVNANPILEETKECIADTLRGLERIVCGRVLNHLIYMMTTESAKFVVATALVHLPSLDQKMIYLANHGLELLLELLTSANLMEREQGCLALHKLAARAPPHKLTYGVPTQRYKPQIYLGEQNVNNEAVSNVTFLIEGKRFYVNKDVLISSSDVFFSMLNGDYKEKCGNDIIIPDIRWDTFEQMIRFIYTSKVDDTDLDSLVDLLRVANQYLLEDLKHLCEYHIFQKITLDNVMELYQWASYYNAELLVDACVFYFLDHPKETSLMISDLSIQKQVISSIRNCLHTHLIYD